MTNLFAEHKDDILQVLEEMLDGEITDCDPTLVDITNVAYYVQMHPDDDLSDKDRLIHKLPWDLCWFEYQEPTKMRVEGEVVDMPEVKGMVTGILAYPISEYENVYHVFLSPRSKLNPRDTIGYAGCLILHFEDPENLTSSLATHQQHNEQLNSREDGLKMKSFLDRRITHAQYAVTFAHCNNVEYYEKSHPEALQKANAKRGKTPQETYKVLDIGGLTKQAKSEATDESGELKTALHICRGHFKTYTEEKPLFGKITGTVWCPPHKRGSDEFGKVNKSYNITTD